MECHLVPVEVGDVPAAADADGPGVAVDDVIPT